MAVTSAPFPQARSKTDSLYAHEVGTLAFTRQHNLAQERYACCGELKVNGHHPICPEYKPPPVEQETLFG